MAIYNEYEQWDCELDYFVHYKVTYLFEYPETSTCAYKNNIKIWRWQREDDSYYEGTTVFICNEMIMNIDKWISDERMLYFLNTVHRLVPFT